MKSNSKGFWFVVFCGVAAIVLSAWAADVNQTMRFRNGGKITLDTTASIADEDGNWTLSSSSLANVASDTHTKITISGTTNLVLFSVTNTAPASTNLVLWVSVQISGDTNAYRIGLAK